MVVQPVVTSMPSAADIQICSNVRPLELAVPAPSVNSTAIIPSSSSAVISAQHNSSVSTNVGSVSVRTSSTTAAQLMINGLGAGCVNNLSNQQQQPHQILSDDPRALQLALELSMVNLNEVAAVGTSTATTILSSANSNNHKDTNNSGIIPSSSSINFTSYQQHMQQNQQQQLIQNQHLQHHQRSMVNTPLQHQQFGLTALSAAVSAVSANVNSNHCHNNISIMNSATTTGSGNNINTNLSNTSDISCIALTSFPVAAAALLPSMDDRAKKSQNMTECVPVPTSEHVAEIVGRQGCKIKALRAKTNTYIKTPVRGEEPVFVVTGRKEDVAKAKREILSAAEHFSLIRATRKPSLDGSFTNNNNSSNVNNNGINTTCSKAPPGPPSIPGQVTIQVRVPYRVVGLVVGPKGATIKHIQHQTQTYIVTPSREKEPIFEVTGLPDNVQSARKQIEAHIALRTGNLPLAVANTCNLSHGNANSTPMQPSVRNDSFSAVQSLNTLSQILNDATADPDLLASIYKSDGLRTSFDYLENNNGIGAATTVAAISGISSPISINNNGINFNNNGGNDDGVIGIGLGSTINNCTAIDDINLSNQLFISSLGNCNNFQLQKLSHSNYNSSYMNNLTNRSNSNECVDNGSGASDIISEFGVAHHYHHNLPPSSTSQSASNIRSQSSSTATVADNHFTNSVNSCTSLNTTAISTSNFTAASRTPVNNGSSGLLNTVNGNGGSNLVNSSVSGNNNANGMARSCSSASSTTSSKSANNSGSGSSNNSNSSRPELINIWKNLGDSLDMDEGIGDSPNIWTLPTPLTTLTGSHCSPSTSISPTDSLLGEISALNQHNHSNSLNQMITGSVQHETNGKKNIQSQLRIDYLQTIINPSGIRRECLMCVDKEVTAVLVPCGHNMFCMDCANRICASGDATCPVCNLTVYHAMRILA